MAGNVRALKYISRRTVQPVEEIYISLTFAEMLHGIIMPIAHLLADSLARTVSLEPISVIIHNRADVNEIEEVFTELCNIDGITWSIGSAVLFSHIAHPKLKIYADNI